MTIHPQTRKGNKRDSDKNQYRKKKEKKNMNEKYSIVNTILLQHQTADFTDRPIYKQSLLVSNIVGRYSLVCLTVPGSVK